MNHAAASSHSHTTAPEVAARRFGLALLISAAGVAALAFMVYELAPETTRTVQSGLVTQNAGVVLASPSDSAPGDLRYEDLLAAFAEALQREDDSALRSVYPTISDRELRILHSLRRRIGSSPLGVTSMHLRGAVPEHVQVDFVIVANQTKPKLRLPFEATIGKARGEWRIEQLH